MAAIRSSWAVPPSIRQYSTQKNVSGTSEKKKERENTHCIAVLSKETIILENVQHPAHLAEYEGSSALLLHAGEELVENDHLARVLNKMLFGGVRWARFL